jgi:hypothetical protein
MKTNSKGGGSKQSQEPPVKYNTEFGYSRKDVILICAGLIAFGYALYYGLQALGLEAGQAGNWVQFLIFMGICVGWVSTYLLRVATKVRPNYFCGSPDSPYHVRICGLFSD